MSLEVIIWLYNAFRVWPHGDRCLYRLGIKVGYGDMDERFAMNKTNDHDSMIHAQL